MEKQTGDSPDSTQSLNEESRKFIAWTREQLANPDNYERLITQIISGVIAYYAQPKELILSKLEEKLVKGGIEHGEPNYSLDFIIKELENEYIDLIGWEMVAYWNQSENGTKALYPSERSIG